jgi:acyl-coenzyme A thioesterase PaaI-like protein
MAESIAARRVFRMTATDIPEGFERHFRQSPLTDPWEPLYSKRTENAVIIGLRLAKPHTNGRGLIHGGLIAALADNAMGHSCDHQMGGVSSLVTIGWRSISSARLRSDNGSPSSQT